MTIEEIKYGDWARKIGHGHYNVPTSWISENREVTLVTMGCAEFYQKYNHKITPLNKNWNEEGVRFLFGKCQKYRFIINEVEYITHSVEDYSDAFSERKQCSICKSSGEEVDPDMFYRIGRILGRKNGMENSKIVESYIEEDTNLINVLNELWKHNTCLVSNR